MKAHPGFLIEAAPYRPAKPKDNTWIERTKNSRKGKYDYGGGQDVPEGTFKGSPASIAQILKSKSKDYKQAMSRLSSYINMSGDNLNSSDKNRLEKAKQALKRAYGKE